MVSFPYTDENTNEDLLIYSDHDKYYGFNSASVHFAIKNTSGKDQFVKIFIPVGNKQQIRNIYHYGGNTETFHSEEIITPASVDNKGSTTPARIIPAYIEVKTQWEQAIQNTFIAPSISRKTTKNAQVDKETGTYFIRSGETQYFKAYIVFSAEQEFFIEAAGDKGGYGHLDPVTFPASDNFDSYTATSALNGLNNGSGWSAAWSTVSGSPTVDIAPPGGQGCIASYFSSAGSASGSRDFSSTSDSTIHFQFNLSINNPGNTYIMMQNAGANRFGLNIGNTGGSSGHLYGTDGASFNTDVGTFSASTWTNIDIKFGHVAGKFAISVNGGSYSADLSANTGSTAVTRMFINHSDSPLGDFYVDDIGPTASASCSFSTPVVGEDSSWMSWFSGMI